MLNTNLPLTVAPAVGPLTTSVCALPSRSFPTIENNTPLSSPVVLVIVTRDDVAWTACSIPA